VAAFALHPVPNLRQWLEELGLAQYASLFARNGIDRATLPTLNEHDLERLGILLGHRKKLIKAIDDDRSRIRERHGARAERRHLTVLFCDILGAAAVSARLGPQDLREILHDFQRCCDEAVRRYDGGVAHLMGDGVLAYFGFPTAHEDDAERAVNAALQIVQSVVAASPNTSHPIEVRIGIASGLVVVGERIESTGALKLVGETPNLASRLQEFAGPNQILVAPRTHQLLGRSFEFDDLGEHQVTGIDRPVHMWRVAKPSSASRFEARQSARLTPLVNREAELALLHKGYHQARRGEGQVILMTGEPGIGKSRLVAALRDELDENECCALSVQCSSYHTTSAWYPIIRHLEDVAGITRDMLPATRLDRLEALADRSADRNEMIPLLAALLSIPFGDRYPPLELTAQQQKNRTIAVLLKLLQARSREKPVLLVFEDVHWIDPSSLELLERIRDRVHVWHMLVVVLSRPEFVLPWTDQPHVTALTINRLGPAEVGAMIEQMTGDDALIRTVQDQIIAKTDGVPLFVEEMTKAVLEGRQASSDPSAAAPLLTVPDTLHDSLMARLDQAAFMKVTAQAAAVIGREFSLDLLKAVATLSDLDIQEAIDRLLQAGLLFRGDHPGHPTYTFKHALVQDEAYASLLRDERRELHLRIAEALCRQFSEIAQAAPEIVAHHYTEAGKTEPAIQHWLAAGRQASRRSAFVEATAHFQIALKLLPDLPEGFQRDLLEVQLQHSLGSAFIAARGFGAAETSRAFKRALALCQKHPGAPQTFAVLTGVIGVHLMRGEFEQCRRLAEDLLEQALRQDDPTPKLMGHRALGMSLFVLGELSAARDHLKSALDLYDMPRHAQLAPLFSQDFKASAQIYLALALVLLGDIREGLTHGREALAHAEHLRHPHSICYVLPFLAGAYLICRDPETAYPIAERTIALSAEYGFPLWSAGGLMLRGWARLELGETATALDELRQSVSALEATDTLIWVQFAHYLVARALATAGEREAALAQVDKILTWIGGTSGRWYEAELHRLKGDLLLQRDDPSGAEASYERAIAIAARQGARLWQLRATNALSALWRAQGRISEAHARLAPLCASFGGEPGSADVRQAQALLNEEP